MSLSCTQCHTELENEKELDKHNAEQHPVYVQTCFTPDELSMLDMLSMLGLATLNVKLALRHGKSPDNILRLATTAADTLRVTELAIEALALVRGREHFTQLFDGLRKKLEALVDG